MRVAIAPIRAKRKTEHIMLVFSGALILLLLMAIFNYGPYVLAIVATSVIFSIIVDASFAKLRKKSLEWSMLVTPLIFALMMPPTVPLWIVAIGAAFGTFFGRGIFGGVGKNIFNPAIVGRLFVTISFPAYMATMWLNPVTDTISAATPLGLLNSGNPFTYDIWDLMIGQVPGTLGETFRLGIIILGLLLIVLKIINWRIPVFYIGSLFAFTAIGHLFVPNTFEDPFISLIVGGLLFGAFFVATDPVTSPMSNGATILYGIGLGIITLVIRNFAAFPEGVMFSVIIMNALAPLLDDLVLTQKYKTVKES